MSYGLLSVMPQGDEGLDSWQAFLEALVESYNSHIKSQSNGHSNEHFSPVEVANQSVSWSLMLDSYRRTIYSTMTRARLAVVFVGGPFDLAVIKALLGDRCEEIYIDKRQLVDK